MRAAADVRHVSQGSRQQKVIGALTSLALRTNRYSDLLHEAARQLAESCSADFVEVLEFAPDHKTLCFCDGVGWSETLDGRTRTCAAADSPVGLAILANEPVVILDLAGDHRFQAPSCLREEGVVSGMIAVIAGQKRPFGAIGVYSRHRREFPMADLDLLRTVASLLAVAMEEHRLQQALRESDARMKAILNTLVDGIITIDERGRIDLINPAAERIFGYTSAELQGRNVNVLMIEADRAAHDRHIAEYLQTGKAKVIGIGREVIGRRKDGMTLPMDLAVSELRIGDRRMFTGIVRDITEGRRLERAILEAGSEEQRRIGQDIHDGLCQHLTGVALATEVVNQKLAARAAPELAAVRQVAELVDQAITQARELAHGLQPISVEGDGLTAALEALAKKIRTTSGVTCSFVCDRGWPISDPAISTHLYRIAQEATSNALKHGKPTSLSIELRIKHGELRLIISDNGIGFANARTDGKGIGLRTMEYRGRMVGGEILVRPRSGGGTTVTCAIPIRNLSDGGTRGER